MTRTRGRALIISNRYEYTNVEGKTVWRQGSQHDHTNIMLMLERCGFVVTGEHKNYSAQVDAQKRRYLFGFINQSDIGFQILPSIIILCLIKNVLGTICAEIPIPSLAQYYIQSIFTYSTSRDRFAQGLHDMSHCVFLQTGIEFIIIECLLHKYWLYFLTGDYRSYSQRDSAY